MARLFSACVVVYVLFFIILDHGYMQKEVPFVGVDLSVALVRACAPALPAARAPDTRARARSLRLTCLGSRLS